MHYTILQGERGKSQQHGAHQGGRVSGPRLIQPDHLLQRGDRGDLQAPAPVRQLLTEPQIRLQKVKTIRNQQR